MTAAQREARTYSYNGPVVYKVEHDTSHLPKSVIVTRIIEATVKETGITYWQMQSYSRERDILEARGIACALIKRYTGSTYGQIGQLFNRDHTTAMHSCSQVKTWIDVDSHFVDKIFSVWQNIENQ